MDAISYTEARNNLTATLDRVTVDHEPVIITRRGAKPAVLIALDDYNAWQETEYLTQSPANAADFLSAVEEFNNPASADERSARRSSGSRVVPVHR